MVGLQRDRATSVEQNCIEPIKAPILLKAALAVGTM